MTDFSIDHPLLLVRHGETDWNAEERFQGQTDIPLNDTGRDQARRNGTLIADLVAGSAGWQFLASPMTRTRETMEIVRAAIGLDRSGYQLDERLKELSFGTWERRTLAEIGRDEPEAIAARALDKWNYVPPNGESYALLGRRVAPVFQALTMPTVMVAHGGTVRVVLHCVYGVAADEVASLRIPQDRVLACDRDGWRWV